MIAVFNLTLDPFTITIVFIILSAFIAALVKGRKKDKCLKHFKDHTVSIQLTGEKVIWGRLELENTGLELVYNDKHHDPEGHIETSFILYKNEFSELIAVAKYFKDLTEKQKKQRQRQLKKTYHPGILRRFGRWCMNIFRTLRDSFMEVINLFIARTQKAGGFGQVLSSQGKYVSQMKGELISSISTAYEPLLEKHIGKKVVFELASSGKPVEMIGILREYSAEFIELLDVQFSIDGQKLPETADLIVPRSRAVVRHLGE